MSPVMKEQSAERVLVVDDSEVMRNMIVACLRARPGMTFTHARSGLEAIERLSLGRFDLMVLDLHMPDIGGYEVVEFLRRQDMLRTLPILVVTTQGGEAAHARARERRLAVMTKPFTPAALLAEASEFLDASPPA